VVDDPTLIFKKNAVWHYNEEKESNKKEEEITFSTPLIT